MSLSKETKTLNKYQTFLNGCAEKALVKVGGCIECHSVDLATELGKGLVCKSNLPQNETRSFSFSPLVDEAWHFAILETETYQKLCSELGQGHFLHHSLQTAADSIEEKKERLVRTKTVYESRFGVDPPEFFWSELQYGDEFNYNQLCDCVVEVEVEQKRRRRRSTRHPPGTTVQLFIKYTSFTVTLRVSLSETTWDVMKRIEERKGIPVRQQRLIFAGKQLEDGRSVSSYEIKNESTLLLTLKLRGC